MTITERINNHLRILAPHIAKRETANLLRDAVVEIERLRKVIENSPPPANSIPPYIAAREEFTDNFSAY